METVQIIVTAVISLLTCGMGGLLVYLINLKAKKRTETANADLATANADKQVGDNWKTYAEEQTKSYNNLKSEFEEYKAKQEERNTISEKRDSVFYQLVVNTLHNDPKYCAVEHCKLRRPEEGAYHTKIFSGSIFEAFLKTNVDGKTLEEIFNPQPLNYDDFRRQEHKNNQ